jgi:uncharacterized membrane protein
MMGIIEVTGVGLLFLAGLIALIIQSIPQLRRYAPHPVIAFIEGLVIAYILDDFLPNLEKLTYGDIIATITFVVFLIIYLVPIIRDWFKSRNQRLEKIENHLHKIDIKMANLDGKIEAILHKQEKRKK